MSTVTFKQFLQAITEDASADVAKLQSDIATIDALINQRTSPLLAQKQRLQKMLALKQKQQQVDDAKNLKQQQQQPQQSQQQPTAPQEAGGSDMSLT